MPAAQEVSPKGGLLHRAGRCLSVVLCTALVLAVAAMALAVLVQALAVLVVAVLAAALFLPHPLKWYAKEGAEAVKLFLRELFGEYLKKEEALPSSDNRVE
ncbi:MAG: hypothetical protein IJB29_06555 [Mailhella sp.]|nr:hypothetical protein [Mailhella sp.]